MKSFSGSFRYMHHKEAAAFLFRMICYFEWFRRDQRVSFDESEKFFPGEEGPQSVVNNQFNFSLS